MMKYLLIFLFIGLTTVGFGQIKIVILGSSTAAGTGVSHPDSSWVNKYRRYVQFNNDQNEVINLAKGGYTTFHILPTGTSTSSNRPNPDNLRNISAALAEKPDAIIINLPSNDAASEFSVTEQLDNYKSILTVATGIPIWIATPQGRNLSASGRKNLLEMRDSTFAVFGDKTIDFWKYIGQTNGTLNTIYDSGDGVHLNDKGHELLFKRVVEKHIVEMILSVDENDNNLEKITILPNPVKPTFFVDYNDKLHHDLQLKIYNVQGQSINDFTLIKHENRLEIGNNWKKGIYFLVFSSGTSTFTKKIIKL